MSRINSGRHLPVISLVLLLFLLAACGTNASTTTGSTAPTPTAIPTQLPLQQCGAIHTLGLRLVPTDQKSSPVVEGCFWHAYQQCHPATLVYTQGGVDAAMIHTFSLKSTNGKCTINDALQHVIYPRMPTSVGNDTCTGLTQQANGLRFLACGKEGDILVPIG